jgi:uncharacterized protein DUF1207
MQRASRATLTVVTLAALVAARPARAAHLGGSLCDGGIPADETLGLVWFPRGDLFCPLISDPKGDGSFLSYVRGTSTSAFGTDVGSVGIGDRLGLFRSNGPHLGEGVQLSLTGSVYAQFDLNKPSYDLINADYQVGLPLTIRRGHVATRIRLYHQSSHLGDEYILNNPVVRENLAFQALEVLLSGEEGPLRAYGGGEYLFGASPREVETRLVHGGVELRQPGRLMPAGPLGNMRLVAGLDVKSVEELDWRVAWSARAGFEFGPDSEREHRTKRWSLLGEYYDGPSPYGQFFRDYVRYYGLGLRVGI